ncbi:MAG: VPLPA-CTERM sorting domain-containing protein [Thermodesulfobacteriota bacterium]
MKKIIVATLSLCLGLLHLAGSAGASTTVLTFEDLGVSGPMPEFYGGIDWRTVGNWSHYDHNNAFQWPYTPHSGSEIVYYGQDIIDPEPVQLRFENPVRFDGAWFSGFGEFASNMYTVQLDLYLGSTLVHSTDTLIPTPEPTFLATNYGGLVDHVVFNSPTSARNSIAMDDLTFDPAPVPVPAALYLLGSGLIGLAGFKRKKG